MSEIEQVRRLQAQVKACADVQLQACGEMVRAIVTLGKGIGATVIAEGIHTQEEVSALQDLGVSWGQGYLLARPDAGPE